MAAYLQMGHDSENLVGATGLEEYRGIILSPVNRNATELAGDVPTFRAKSEYDIVLDPQLYFPRSERGALPTQSYFPRDIDTADFSSEKWWAGIVKSLAEFGKQIGANAICSPALVPERWNADYYTQAAMSYDLLRAELDGSSVRPVLTVCVSLSELGDPNSAFRIASALSENAPSDYYIVAQSDIEPRRELQNAENLCGLMILIAALKQADATILVSHCSSDMILAKAAGANHAATGKFFNLRRFTRGRFEEPGEKGGGQIPYWFEQSLLAFLRQADILRLRRSGFAALIGVGDSTNHWGNEIMAQSERDPGAAWLGLSWRHYLSWFGRAEDKLSGTNSAAVVNDWLRQAESNWESLENQNVLLEERRNDGRWVRPWRQAIGDFLKIEIA
jgi:hypothetical protein